MKTHAQLTEIAVAVEKAARAGDHDAVQRLLTELTLPEAQLFALLQIHRQIESQSAFALESLGSHASQLGSLLKMVISLSERVEALEHVARTP